MNRSLVPRLLVMAAALCARPAVASCTFTYNPWGGAACEPGMSNKDCFALWDDALHNPVPGFKAIPVYANFDETFFPQVHPDDPKLTFKVNRSLIHTGLSEPEIVDQIKAAIARWNQAVAGYPALYYAGPVRADLSPAAENDRPVGIVIESMTCFDNDPRSNAWPGQPGWAGDDSMAYRARVRIAPSFHSVDMPGYGEKPCEVLDPKWIPKGLAKYPHGTWTDEIAGGYQDLLVHEIGHTLGLKHNFLEKDDTCGLGFVKPDGSSHAGVMAYLGAELLRPRRDDIEGMRAMHRGVIPSEWPILDWHAAGGLPPAWTPYAQNPITLQTTVMPVLANQVVSMEGRGALVYADADHQVRVRTFTSGVMDPVLAVEDLVWNDELGKTFSPAAVAIRSTYTFHTPELFVAWNEDNIDRNSLDTYWAIRDLDGLAWEVFGPQPLGLGRERYEPVVGATYDPVFDDYVLLTLSNDHEPLLSVVSSTGDVTSWPTNLDDATGGLVDPVNAVGSPVCIRNGPPGESLCLIPTATDGEGSVVSVLSLRRTAGGFEPAREWRPSGNASCPEDPGCEDFAAYGNLSLSWNEIESEGMLAYTNERGDVSFLEVDVLPGIPGNQPVVFSPLGLDMYGNGRYLPDLLGESPRDVVDNLIHRWPVCPYWDASVSGTSNATSLWAPVVNQITRATCLPVCGDGFVDIEPFGSEECDGSVTGLTCEDFGFDAGTLSCDAATCEVVLSACTTEPPDPPPPPDNGDCKEVITGCGDVTDDGCYPDGPGSFWGTLGDGGTLDKAGLYCPDNDKPSVCGLSKEGNCVVPTCFTCAEPGNSQGDVAYGCPCATDADCEATGIGVVSGYYNGTEIPLSCYGSEEQGWNGLGTCLPDIDPVYPQQNSPSANIEEFERTRWLCKQNCESLGEAAGMPYACHFRQSLDLTYAVCVDDMGCDGFPGGGCEESGGSCNQQTDTCDVQCSPDGLPASEECAALGYPSWWSCAFGWQAEGFCVPPECQTPGGDDWDLSACQMFVGTEIF